MSCFTLPALTAEISQWLATGRSRFAELADKLGLATAPDAPTLLDRLLPTPADNSAAVPPLGADEGPNDPNLPEGSPEEGVSVTGKLQIGSGAGLTLGGGYKDAFGGCIGLQFSDPFQRDSALWKMFFWWRKYDRP